MSGLSASWARKRRSPIALRARNASLILFRSNRKLFFLGAFLITSFALYLNVFQGLKLVKPFVPNYGDLLATERNPSPEPGVRDVLDDVLHLDEDVLANVKATYQSARSWVEWSTTTLGDVKLADNLSKFQPEPLVATVDRRALTARKQMVEDEFKLHNEGKLLGCAMTGVTFLSVLSDLYREFEEVPVTCSVCVQFSNRHDVKDFLPDVGYEPLKKEQTSTATKCFNGEARIETKFQKWQSGDSRFVGFGYPWTVDCMLPNGIKELTCEGIRELQEDPINQDAVQKVYFETNFSLDGFFSSHYAKAFNVVTQWPWDAVKSHDDDRSHFAESLPDAFDDETSTFVPNSADELNLMHVVGPSYRKDEINGTLALESMKTYPNSHGGVHVRLIPNLYHLIRNAPRSTHMIAVVDGQLHRTMKLLEQILNEKFTTIYPKYGKAMLKNLDKKMEHIPITTMNEKVGTLPPSLLDLKLKDVLHLRKMKILVVPVTTPNIAFEHSVCGGQYALTSYLAARYAPDYHVIMYIDGDTAMIEKNERTMQRTYYDRFFSTERGTGCAGHRYYLLEQYVRPKDNNSDRILTCAKEMVENEKKWKYAVENCHLKEGHIVARTDSIHAFNVHHPDTLSEYVPEGVEDCITPGNAIKQPYFMSSEEIVQIHLRDRERKPECTCFVPPPE